MAAILDVLDRILFEVFMSGTRFDKLCLLVGGGDQIYCKKYVCNVLTYCKKRTCKVLRVAWV